MVINYIILAYKTPCQVQRLVHSLAAEGIYFYIHIDKKVDVTPFQDLLRNEPRVLFLPPEKRVDTVWGSLSIIHATLKAMQEVVKHNSGNGYTVLLSGQCYPLKSNAYIHEYLSQNYGTNFIEGFTLPSPAWPNGDVRFKHYTFFISSSRKGVITVPPFTELFHHSHKCRALLRYFKILLWRPQSLKLLMHKRKMFEKLIPYGGLAYWALPIESIKLILQFIEANPDYLHYHQHTLYPEETFFQTILYNLSEAFASPPTFACWTDLIEPSPQTFTNEWFSLLKARQELFARKFDMETDTKILDRIDQELLL